MSLRERVIRDICTTYFVLIQIIFVKYEVMSAQDISNDNSDLLATMILYRQ